MSRSFTVKPSVAQSQGRGRGNTAPPTQQQVRGRARGGATVRSQTDRLATRHTQTGMNQEQEQLEDGATGRRPGAEPAGLGQRMSHQGAFTMITPNERRRQEISEQARREEENYQRHKENNRLGYVNYVGTAGGGQKTQTEARNEQARTHQSSKYESIQKRQAAREAPKKREEEEISKKKMEQRRKSEQNKQLESERQRKLQEDHRSKNEAFLRRIENEQKFKTRSKQPPAVSNPVVQSDRNEAASSSQDLGDPLGELQGMFPMYDQDSLRDILTQTGSVEAAIGILSLD